MFACASDPDNQEVALTTENVQLTYVWEVDFGLCGGANKGISWKCESP